MKNVIAMDLLGQTELFSFTANDHMTHQECVVQAYCVAMCDKRVPVSNIGYVAIERPAYPKLWLLVSVIVAIATMFVLNNPVNNALWVAGVGGCFALSVFTGVCTIKHFTNHGVCDVIQLPR